MMRGLLLPRAVKAGVTRDRSLSVNILVAEIAGLAVALGLGLWTMSLFVLWWAGVPIVVGTLLSGLGTAAALVIGAVMLVRARASAGLSVVGRSPATWGLVGLGGAAVVYTVVSAIVDALRSPNSAFDAWSFWAYKARLFEAGGPALAYFRDPLTLYTHPDYPLNLPLAEVALSRVPVVGAALTNLVGPLCLAALLLLWYAGLARLHGRATASLGVAILLLVPAVRQQAASGDADVSLSLYAGAALLYLLSWRRLHCSLDLVVAALCAGAAIWTKKEGMIVALVLIVTYLMFDTGVSGHRWARVRHAVAFLAATLALPAPWLLFTFTVHPLGHDFLPVTPGVFLMHLDRLPTILSFFLLQMLAFANWSVLWLSLAALLVVSHRRLTADARIVAAIVMLHLLLYALVFVFSDWQPYIDHLRTSLDRLFVGVVPAAVLAVVEATGSLSRPLRGRAPRPLSAPSAAS